MSSVSLDGRPLKGARVLSLKTGVSKEQLREHLDNTSDGYDTYVVNVNGKDKLIRGRGLPADVLGAARIKIDGQPAQFISRENEPNTFKEGFDGALHTYAHAFAHPLGRPGESFYSALKGACVEGLLVYAMSLTAVVGAKIGLMLPNLPKVGTVALGAIIGFFSIPTLFSLAGGVTAKFRRIDPLAMGEVAE